MSKTLSLTKEEALALVTLASSRAMTPPEGGEEAASAVNKLWEFLAPEPEPAKPAAGPPRGTRTSTPKVKPERHE